MAAKTTSKQETNKGFYHLLILQFKQVFSFAKIENLPWWIKTVKNVSNYQISIGKLLSEVHIDAWTNLEAWNGGNDFGICRWRFINKFSVFNEMKIYSDGSKWEQNWWSNKMITSYKLLYEINMIEHTTSKGWKEEMLMEFLNDAI